MVLKLVGLTFFGVCVLHCLELDWVRECVAGHVTCKLVHTEDLCHWLAVLQSICYVGERHVCRELPNNSFLFPYCMVSITPVFPLQCHICVYCLVCNAYAEIGLLVLMYRVFFMSCCYWSFRLSYIWIVASVTFEFVYPAGICAGLAFFPLSISILQKPALLVPALYKFHDGFQAW
jgi:hypothetical protein